MNQKNIVGIIIVAVLVISFGVYFSRSGTSKTVDVMSDQGDVKQRDVMTQDTSTTTMSSGSYEMYEAHKITLASPTHNVVLFFRAKWCPTCKAVDADITSHIKDIPENLTILDVDYDTSTDLKKKYGVTYQHTFVQVDAQGNLLKKWSGSPTLVSLVQEVK